MAVRYLEGDSLFIYLVSRNTEKLEEMAFELRKHMVSTCVSTPATLRCRMPLSASTRVPADSLVVDRLVNSAGFGDQGAFIDADWKRQADMIQ